MNRIDAIQPAAPRRALPPFRSGDTVRVHVNITEGDKQRIQIFEGVVIRRRGRGASATFTVRKVAYGVGVERIFPSESPNIKKVEIKSRGHVRRARLYYLRELRGKKARLRSKVRDVSGLISEEEAEGGVGVREEEIAAAEPDDAQANDEPADDASEETQDEPSDESGEGAEETEAKEEESS